MSNFKLTKNLPLPEINCVLREWTHSSGAEVMHLETDDPENVFCIALRTWPSSSNGVAHILEHTVLCGSKKYPIKDPFFAMKRRSLNTFLNAFTGADFTWYPAASQIEKDFYNLFDVYLDAVFHPTIDRFSFLQEGIRYDFENGKLVYKGIVFNEMKGALNSGSARLSEAMMKALMKGTLYGVNSGGDPKNIPELTHEELVNFHKEYYHPSRALFFFYGDIPFQKHLDFLEENLLSNTEKLPPLKEPKRVERFKKPIRLQERYPTNQNDPSPTFSSTGWVTSKIEDHLDSLALTVIAVIIMENDASLLKKEILKSGLASQATIYMDHEMSDHIMMITLIDPKEPEKVEAFLIDKLKKISENGIPRDLIDQAIHLHELSRLEIQGDGHPHGLNLFLASGLIKMHGRPSEEALKVRSLFDALREKLKSNPRYFSDLIDTYLVNNPHSVHITMKPDFNLEKEENEDEALRLLEIQKTLNDAQKKAIIKDAKDLDDLQKLEVSEDILPTLTLADVPKQVKSFPLEIREKENFKVLQHECFTNGLIYADLVYELQSIKDEEIPLFRLLMVLLTQLGVNGKSYEDTLNYMQAHTGGVYASLHLNPQANNLDHMLPAIHIKGKALNPKADKLLELMKGYASTLDLRDKDRICEVFLKHKTNLEASFNQSAFRYATNLSSSALTPATRMSQLCFGLDYYNFIRGLNEPPFEKLIELYTRIFNYRAPDLVLGGEKSILLDLEKHNYYGLGEIKTHNRAHSDWSLYLGTPENRNHPISSGVAFIAHSFKTIPYTHVDSPYLAIASYLFDNLTLHPRIREQGGAYGGGSTSYGNYGYFTFHSYRDPHVKSTLDAFKESIDEVVKGNFEAEDLMEAKLELMQGLDAPVSPGSRAQLAYGWLKEGRSDQIRETNRKRALEATEEHIIRAVDEHIKKNYDKGSTVVFGPETLIKEVT